MLSRREEKAVSDRDGAHGGEAGSGEEGRGRSEVSDGGRSQREMVTENPEQQMEGEGWI